MRVRSTRGIDLAVHDLGGSGAPLLLCHATGFCGKAYLPLAEMLAERFHVHAMDFRGHGESDAPADDDYSWWRMAEDARAVAEALGGPVVVGHSMGAAAALLAEQEHPGTLPAAYVFEPALGREYQAGMIDGIVAHTLKRAAVFDSREQAGARLRERDAYRSWTEASMQAFLDHALEDRPDGRVALRCRPEHEALCYSSPKVSAAGLRGVGVPVRVGVGSLSDPLGANSTARDLVAVLPRGELVEHTGTTHFAPFEDPAAVAASAVEFLGAE